jgi:Flp pilus assembly protein TadD
MRKAITSASLLSICAMIFLFSACSLFQDSHRSASVLTGKDAEKFIGSIRARHGNAASHYELGCYMQERKKHKPAIEEFKTAIEFDPNHVKAYNGLGISYDALGDHARAVEAYTAALKVYPKLDYVLNNLGYSYLLQGKTDLAVENFKKALELDSANARYRNNLGLAYAKSGKYDAALAEFKGTSDEARAHYNIAQLYFGEGLYKEAESHFEEASLLKASDPEIEKGLKAAGSLSEILVNTHDRISPTPSHQERPLSTENSPLSTLRGERVGVRGGISTAKTEKVTEAPTQPPIVRIQVRQPKPADSGFEVIPAEALSTPERIEIVEQQASEVPFYRAALARSKVRESAKEEAAKVLEAKPLKLYDEAQALELLSPQVAGMEKGPATRIKIEVSNGNGVRHMARNVGDYLKGDGFIPYYLSNARHFRHEETKIYYTKGYLREASLLAEKLPGRQSLEEVDEIRKGNAEISVVIGKDLVSHLDLFVTKAQGTRRIGG